MQNDHDMDDRCTEFDLRRNISIKLPPPDDCDGEINDNVEYHPRTAFSPFIGRTAKQSRAFVNHIVLALALVMASLIAYIPNLADQGEIAKTMLSRACEDLEVATNALALAPRFTAEAINRRSTDLIRAAVTRAAAFATSTISVLKHVLLYILFRYQRVMLCLLDTTAMAATNAVSASAQVVADAVSREIQAMSHALVSSVGAVNNELDHINHAIRNIPSVPMLPFGFGGGGGIISIPSIPPIVLPDAIHNLQNFQIPRSFVETLQGLNSNIPRLDDVENAVSNLLSGPFDSLAKTVSDALDSISVPDANLLPLPATIEPIRFCHGDAYSFAWIDRMVEAITVSIWYGCFVIAVAMVASTLWYMVIAGWEHMKYERNVRRIARMTLRNQTRRNNLHLIHRNTGVSMSLNHVRMLVNAAQHPIPFVMQDGICRRMLGIDTSLPSTSAHATRIRWFMSYISHPLVIACIVLGATGLIAIRVQLLILGLVASNIVPALASELQIATDVIAERVARAIDDSIGPYISQVNAAIETVELAINDKLFGWARSAVSTIQSGIDTIITGFSDAVTAAFSSVPVIQTVLTSFFTCLVGGAAKTIEAVAKSLELGIIVALPRVNANDLALDAPRLAIAIDTINAIANKRNGTQDPHDSAAYQLFHNQLVYLQHSYERTLWMQMLPFAVAFALGMTVVLFGIVAVFVDLAASSLSRKSKSSPSNANTDHHMNPMAAPISTFASERSAAIPNPNPNLQREVETSPGQSHQSLLRTLGMTMIPRSRA